MKNYLLTLLLSIISILFIPVSGFSQTKTPQPSLAVAGDTVWVIVNQVKADKRAQFERFLHEIFWPGASKLSKEEQRMFRQTRILHPVALEPNGTYSYLFIMDPLIPNSNYSIEYLITKMYGEAKAKEYYKLFTDALAGEFKQYTLVQSRH